MIKKFKFGDVIANKNDLNDRYIITGFGTYMDKPVMYGFNENGQPLGGPTGCTNPERYAFVEHADEYDDIITTYFKKDYFTEFTASDGTIIYNCPPWIDISLSTTTYIVARQSTDPSATGKWYYWSELDDKETAKEVAEDIGGKVFERKGEGFSVRLTDWNPQ